MTLKEERSLERAKKFAEYKLRIPEISEKESHQLLYIGENLLGNMVPGIDNEYNERQQLAITIASMYKLTLEFYDELEAEFKGEKFFQFN